MALFKKKLSNQYDNDPAMTMFNIMGNSIIPELEVEEEIKESISLDKLKASEIQDDNVIK